MNKDDSEAVDSTSTALEASECIGPMADVPILQVMSPTVGTHPISSDRNNGRHVGEQRFAERS